MKGIIIESAVPVRLEPSDRSEMINQLVFGETYKVLEELPKWIKVESTHDKYQGWIDLKQHKALSNDTVTYSINMSLREVTLKSRGQILIPEGALVPDRETLKTLGIEELSLEEEVKGDIRQYAIKFLNAPYLWGGRTRLGIDCSGFTQLVYRMCGVSLLRDASQQVEEGEQVSFLEESKEGDLAFFDNKEGKITHVGIVLEEETEKRIIHASGRVRIDKLDHQGIYNEETQSYSHQLRTIKTIL